MFDRRTNNATKPSRAVNGGTAAFSQFASAQERRAMKKVARPEHAYTGCVPYTPEDDNSDAVPKKRNPPILGYRGHLRCDEDRVGTTFTQGLVVSQRAPEPVLSNSNTKTRPPNDQPRQVRFAEDKADQPKPTGAAKAVGMSPRPGYGQFDNASGYGNFAAPPRGAGNNGMSPRSGYGAFDNASGYGAFAAPPSKADMPPRSGYGEFENASGYGAFAAPPGRADMSPRSGYGAFDNASGYGAFAAPPGGMSPRSGYGAFDNASGYGAFAAPPAPKDMSPRSGYGEFDNASGYGAFSTPPGMSPRSGYGQFDEASGYGNFASPPNPTQDQIEVEPTRGHSTNARFSSREYNPFDDHRENGIRSSNSQTRGYRDGTTTQTPSESVLQAKYQQAIYRIGGEQAAIHLWVTAAQTIWQRFMTRTDLLQTVKRSFEKHERTNHGFMTKVQFKEALRDLSCVFTDDQITALFGIHDTQCTGSVPMPELLLRLTEKL